ncbi:MAG: hypothetical protein JXA96_10690 [Sedimentisphaerales bacterium]|nr:hypothetical protein [Sedimentisphaerales bacterium]
MSRTTCPDCNEELQPIKIIDATLRSAGGSGHGHVELSYSAVDAERSLFMGAFKREGTIQGKLCPKCGRILLYAGPK